MLEPKVSIIIPVYNGENYLQDAIDSALKQTYSNIEVIVVNDGSCDNGATEKIALSYGDKVRYFYKENGGVATALNLGISKMQGEYFSWLSHDDMYYPEKIEKQIFTIKKNQDKTVIVLSDYDLLDVNSQLTTSIQHSRTYPLEKLTDSVFPVLLGLVHGCSLLVHKSHFDRVGLFDRNLITTQDYDLWFRMFRNQRTIYIPEPLILTRVHNQQGSRTLICHDLERCRLHHGFLNALTKKEMCSMFGSQYNFYYKMCCFFKAGKMDEAYEYSKQKFEESEVPDNLESGLLHLREYINTLSDRKANRICIFGAGEYGIRLYHELSGKLVSIDCFSDNDANKCGKDINGISCIPIYELKTLKDHTLVIVANRAPGQIVKQLKSEGFPFVITKQEIDWELFQVSPDKTITVR